MSRVAPLTQVGQDATLGGPADAPPATMEAAVLALWPEAPIAARSDDGRWLRFDRHPHGVVYLQRYAWEEPCTPHFLVVACGPTGGVRQEKHVTLVEAVADLRRLMPPRAAAPAPLWPVEMGRRWSRPPEDAARQQRGGASRGIHRGARDWS